MIIAPHLIVGAAIGAKTHNLGLIIILGLISHFLMDKIPHWDYGVKNIEDYRIAKKIKYLFYLTFKLFIDAAIGLSIVYLIILKTNLLNVESLKYIAIGIFFPLLPDMVLFTNYILIGKTGFYRFHKKYLHYKCEKEGVPTFLNLSTEIAVILIAALLFFV